MGGSKIRTICLLLLCWALTCYGFAALDTAGDVYDAARLSWDTGDYVRALEGFRSLLSGPDAPKYLEPVALLTGELFSTREIAQEGRSIKVSPDGSLFSYEAGAQSHPVCRIYSFENPTRLILEVRGSGVAFSPVGRMAAVLRVPDIPEIARSRAELDKISSQPSPDRQAQAAKQREISRLEARYAEIITVNLDSREERRLDTAEWLKAAPSFSSDGRELYFTCARESDPASDICATGGDGRVIPLTSGKGFKINPQAIPGGKWLLYSISMTSPFPRPPSADSGNPPPQAGGARTGQASDRPFAAPGEGFGRFAPPREFALMNLADKSVNSFSGAAPSFSADGNCLVFVSQEGNDSILKFLKFDSDLKPASIKKTQERIGSASLSADGRAVTFEMTYTRNGEVFWIQSDGTGEKRLSRDIEPDRAPRFLASGTVLAVRGEPRHSRAYLYDLKSGRSMRLFHNNTVRTLSMEYEWAADVAGARLLISADRDGDTISRERGIYLVELSRKISGSELLDRIDRNLASERALRSWAEKTFAPLRTAIQSVVERVSVTRIFDYEKALFDFDSKHISMPGNRKAAEYIFGQLESFGYRPEFQEFESRGIKTANVLARLPGIENPEIVCVLSGHFDSNQRGPGADDNSSATAVNLETARILARTPQPNTIVFAFCTGEEAGLLGSREFVRVAQANDWKIAADLNNDMIGWTNDHRIDNTIRFSNPGIRDIGHAAALLFSRMVTYDTRYVKSTDAVSFYEAFGDIIGGLGSYPLLGNPYYHQPTDLLETVNHQLLVEAAKYNTAALMMMASSPQPVKGVEISQASRDSADIRWKPGPERAIVSYALEYGVEGNPAVRQTVSDHPGMRLAGLKLKPGHKLWVAVRAVSRRGLLSWDWSRAAVEWK